MFKLLVSLKKDPFLQMLYQVPFGHTQIHILFVQDFVRCPILITSFSLHKTTHQFLSCPLRVPF